MSPERLPIRTIIVANNREYFSPIDPFVSEAEKPEFVESDYDDKRGVIITQSMKSKYGRGKFGYLIFGIDQDDTKTIEEGLELRMDSIRRPIFG